jgi:hypothetical protein
MRREGQASSQREKQNQLIAPATVRLVFNSNVIYKSRIVFRRFLTYRSNYYRVMHPVGRTIKLQDKTFVPNN